MKDFVAYLAARAGEPSTWGGLAAFLGSTGASLVAAGLHHVGVPMVATGAGASGVAVFLKEGRQPPAAS